MGGALATLGLLSSCHWDNDEIYQPRLIGTYLLADSALFFIPPTGSLELLRYAQALAGDGQMVGILSKYGEEVLFYEPGKREPTLGTHVILAAGAATDIAPKPEKAGFYVSGPSYWGSTTRFYFVEFHDALPTDRIYSGSTFLLRQVGDSVLYAAPAQSPLVPYARAALPGPIAAVWNVPPLGMEGTFRYRDTLYPWRYHAPSRTFSWDTTSPSRWVYVALSPYLSQRLGTEYLGRVELSSQGMLNPLGLPAVECFAVDFLGARVYYIRRDTLWEYHLLTRQAQVRSTPFSAKRLSLVAAYTYGEALITTR